MERIPADEGRKCRICDTPTPEVFFESSEVPVQSNSFWPTREQALQCPKGNIELAFCANCGGTTNPIFEPRLVEYDQNYENSLHFSPSFQEYAETLAADLIYRYKLRNKVIVEIGCGKGEFLAILCRLGNNRGLGFDPTYVEGRGDPAVGRGITYINELDACTDQPCDFICCRQVLEHVPDPKDLLSRIWHSLENAATPVFFEVPNVRYTLQDGGIWDIIYPHCIYFSAESLQWLFTSCGFGVSSLRESFGGQYLCIEALIDKARVSRTWNDTRDMRSLANDIAKFRQDYMEKVNRVAEILDRLKCARKRTVVWGAGSKGVTFLNKFKGTAPIDYVVDINPHKHGEFVPGSGQQITPPDFLREYRPDSIIVLNPNYRSEIARQVEHLGLKPEFIFV